MSFKEALPHHVRFVKWCVFDWQPFSRSRSAAFRAFVSGLNPAAGLPHRETSIKILRVAGRALAVAEMAQEAVAEEEGGKDRVVAAKETAGT